MSGCGGKSRAKRRLQWDMIVGLWLASGLREDSGTVASGLHQPWCQEKRNSALLAIKGRLDGGWCRCRAPGAGPIGT